MSILCGRDAWRALDRWNQPCERPTYRTAVIQLAPELVAHAVAIAVRYDAADFFWNAADPDDQHQLESLWSGFVIEGSSVPLIRCDEHEFFVAFQPTGGARTTAVVITDRRKRAAASTAAKPSLIEASRALLHAWDSYDDTGPVPLDDAIDAVRAALTNAASNATPEIPPPPATPA